MSDQVSRLNAALDDRYSIERVQERRMMRRTRSWTVAIALLAVIPLAACDGGGGVGPPPPPIVGTISGTVFVEGTGLAGVTVNIVGTASQTATTGAGGTYSFSNVPAGTYGVQISGGPADVTFATTSTVVTISTSGQTVTADFSGSYIRTSRIHGSVTDGAGGGIGATVVLNGVEYRSGVSDANGNFAFTGVRSGTHTVTISDFGTATFAITSRDVTVAVGQSAAVSFVGTVEEVAATVTISSITVSGAATAVIPTAVIGAINVNLTIHEGTETLIEASVLLDGGVVGTQTFTAGAPAQDRPEGAIRTATIQINTAAYPNGDHVISAQITTVDNGAGIQWTRSSPSGVILTFANTASLTVTTTILSVWTVGEADYNQRLSAEGGTPPYVWEVGALPDGLTLNRETGGISGTPTRAGTWSFTVAVTDADAVSSTRELSITIEGLPPAPTLYEPSRGSSTSDNTPRFDWSEPPFAARYDLIVDNNSDWSSPEIRTQTDVSEYTSPSDLPEGTYYWNVHARNTFHWGLWGNTQSFTITNATSDGPQINVSPEAIDFGAVTLFQSKSAFITIRNSQTATATLDGRASIPGPSGPGFAIADGDDFSLEHAFSLEPGESDVIQVYFFPGPAGEYSKTLSIYHNAVNQDPPLLIPLTGIGSGAAIAPGYPASIDFGPISVGSNDYKTFSITNSSGSSGPLTGNVSISGAAYALERGEGQFSLSPGTSHEMTVRFSPSSVGFPGATVSISHNAVNADNPIKVFLSGEAVGEPTTPQTPLPPTITSVGSATVSSLRVNWSDVSGEDRYLLEVKPSASSAWDRVIEISSNTTEGNVGGLSPTTTYDFRLRACLSGASPECSPWSDIVSGTTSSALTISAVRVNDGFAVSDARDNPRVRTGDGERAHSISVEVDIRNSSSTSRSFRAVLRLLPDDTSGVVYPRPADRGGSVPGNSTTSFSIPSSYFDAVIPRGLAGPMGIGLEVFDVTQSPEILADTDRGRFGMTLGSDCGVDEGDAYLLAEAVFATAPKRGAVVLVHGFVPFKNTCDEARDVSGRLDYWNITGSSAEWDALAVELGRDGRSLWLYSWPTYASIEAAGDNLRRLLLRKQAELGSSITLVGHSMGGIVSARALASGRGLADRVDRVITLGTPHTGTPRAAYEYVYKSLPFVNLGDAVSVTETAPWSPFLALVAGDVERAGLIGRLRLLGARENAAGFDGYGDGLVNLESALGVGYYPESTRVAPGLEVIPTGSPIPDWEFPNLCHRHIKLDSRVWFAPIPFPLCGERTGDRLAILRSTLEILLGLGG